MFIEIMLIKLSEWFSFAQTLVSYQALWSLLKLLIWFKLIDWNGTRLRIKRKNLYEFWDKKIAKAIMLPAEGEPIVNLASQEYFKSVILKTVSSPGLLPFISKDNSKWHLPSRWLFLQHSKRINDWFAIKKTELQIQKVEIIHWSDMSLQVRETWLRLDVFVR